MIYIDSHNYNTVISSTGGTQRLPRIVGQSLAKELIFTARVLDGSQASKIGLVNYSVPQCDTHDAAYQRSLELAQEITPQVGSNVKSFKFYV